MRPGPAMPSRPVNEIGGAAPKRLRLFSFLCANLPETKFMNTNSRQEARASHTRKLSGTRSMATTKTTLTEQEIDTMTWMYRVAGVPQQKLARDYEISRS